MSAAPSPAPPPLPPQQSSSRQKKQPVQMGLAAGAEDAKYQAKYKELKRKVKDIEQDNDKLHFKVLQAKLNIRRMKMERAILYERLSTVPPSPNLQDRHPLPSAHSVSGVPPASSRSLQPAHQHREIRDHPSNLDLDQQGLPHPPSEHVRSHGGGSNSRHDPRINQGMDPRPIPAHDNPVAVAAGGGGAASSPHLHVLSPRRATSVHEGSAASRHPQQQQLPPIGQLPPVHPYEGSRSSSLRGTPPPPIHHPGSGGHSRNQSHSSPRSHSRSHQSQAPSYRSGGGGPPPGPGHPHHQYPESLPSAQQTLHSPSERERPLPRRSEHHHSHHTQPHEYSHGETHSYDRHPPSHPSAEPSRAGGAPASGRIHAHQRLGPGTYITRDEYPPPHENSVTPKPQVQTQHRERDLEREREWERERDRARDYSRGELYSPHRPRQTQSSAASASAATDHLVSSSNQTSSSSRTRNRNTDPNNPNANTGPPPLPPSAAHSGGGAIDDRDNQPYYPGEMHGSTREYPRLATRDDTPGSGSASGSVGAGGTDAPSRPDSPRSQYYERDRARGTYRVRQGAMTNDAELPPAGHTPTPPLASGATPVGGAPGANASAGYPSGLDHQQNIPALESRKRSRNEMEVDSDDDVAGDGGSVTGGREVGGGGYGGGGGGGRLQPQDDRGSKRYHRETE